MLESKIICGDNLEVLESIPDNNFQMIYIDPPFNTGRLQTKQIVESSLSDSEGHVGFAGNTYLRVATSTPPMTYSDSFQGNYLEFLSPRLRESHRVLKDSGTLYVHLDWREVHYVKVLLDQIFGRENFLNEIIWAYDYGAKSKRKWPTKHDTILVYVKNRDNYYFDSTEVDREPYMAPGLVTPEKVALGKLPTDVWWHTIVPTNGAEKTGYPTQKPEGILKRMITASTREGDWVLDFFAGSGTTGAVAKKLGRNFILVDSNPQAIEVINRRLSLVTTAE